ncbi:NLP/P60 protein [Desulfarculus baarsii DSM 2075]|uniref:NLP/P60 protein n=1 Tax=Desulfarculus baarsii (strain ATCC 33931 / DSM 2075 / LMG 7858 / VKM B-1802 / 2st14) TaxID=644282 RepID=E1QI83_DESB2|nr:SH3 domain-containing C40 family peptidase [Desulfarculus baarsii]ADK85400.1 NLP/P60 protein [Desulfarculus baarsii DSM 2075]
MRHIFEILRNTHSYSRPNKNLGARLAVLALAALLALGGCAGPSVKPADIQLPPQEAARYLGRHWRLDPAAQARLTKDFWRQYFACWQDPRPEEGLVAMVDEFADKTAQPGLGENLLPRDPAWVEALEANAALASYPNAARPGLTVGWLNLRVLPTDRPSVGEANAPGDLTFDRLQQSLLPPNLPVYVHHQSRDGAWLLVQTPIAWGWLPSRQVAAVSQAQQRRWRAAGFMAFLADDQPVNDRDGRFLFMAGLGCLLPVAENGHGALAAVADQHGNAVIVEAHFDRRWATPHPLPLTAVNLAAVIDGQLGRPYGWGGLFGNRDCSATLQDVFRVFGLWLPRNSGDQAETGRRLGLAGQSAARKEATIVAEGLPGLTILWMPGHVMLYLGDDNGRPVAFHNAWSLRLRDFWGNQGRAILGRALITTLRPGDDLPDLVKPDGVLVNRLEAMTLLVEPSDVLTIR